MNADRISYHIHEAMPVVCGCYMLFKNRKLVYIGRSKNVYARIESHRQNGRDFDYAAVTALPDADTAWVERALIEAHETRNRALAPKPQTVAEKVRMVEQSPAPAPVRELVAMSGARARVSERASGLGLNVAAAVVSGVIPSFTEGRVTRVKSSDLDAWITARIAERFEKVAP